MSNIAGRVVEIGAGTGLTFAHYPATVDSVVAVEPDPYRRAMAARVARGARVPIDVVSGVAEALPIADDTIDAAVSSLVLCSVSDVALALAELQRVLRPSGELRFLEHVIAERGPLRMLQRVAAPVYSRTADGCHIARDTLTSITRAGFTVKECHRFMHADGSLEPAIPHVLGRARRSEPDADPNVGPW